MGVEMTGKITERGKICGAWSYGLILVDGQERRWIGLVEKTERNGWVATYENRNGDTVKLACRLRDPLVAAIHKHWRKTTC